MMTGRGHQGRGRRRDARERRCIVTGEVLPESKLIRFVVGPDGEVVPDVAAKLPGRGIWVERRAPRSTRRSRRTCSPRRRRRTSKAAADLAARVEALLVARMLGDLGMARRAGALVLGFDNVLRALAGPKPPPAF